MDAFYLRIRRECARFAAPGCEWAGAGRPPGSRARGALLGEGVRLVAKEARIVRERRHDAARVLQGGAGDPVGRRCPSGGGARRGRVGDVAGGAPGRPGRDAPAHGPVPVPGPGNGTAPGGAASALPRPARAGHCGAAVTWRAAIVFAVSESGPGCGTKIASR
ncbi:hypothetical protein SSP531S_12760 [Streptomyces spongiicola]|uniref:Uncharacterized protein n=1 Tax=Streptomyces spongiicola TaxID=1690221 RepID=A0A388SUU5_9ACTN|nr:hypothetical protein SSP531S_12760 [Streptomyces spongiicola]